MFSFLEKTIEYIYKKHGDNIGNICIVLPNRRSKLYLQKHLSALITGPVWAPRIYAIEDFIIELSGFSVADNLQLIFSLFDTHKAISGDKADSFDKFLSWGQILLHDFNEIDLYQVKPEELFTFLNDVKNIAAWNPGKSEITENQKKYIRFFSSLLGYYRHFTASIIAKKQVYNGLAYRFAAENISSLESKVKAEKIYFAGLNALTIAEEIIVKHFEKQNRAELLWDADRYYMDSRFQEAGRFLRDYREAAGIENFKWVDDNFREKKTLNIIGIPKHIGQVKYAGKLISELFKSDEKSLENTAVVLAEENLLMPLLNSMPENSGRFNVTMGLPLKNIPLFDLFLSVLNLHINAARLNKTNASGNLCFYFKDILKFIGHQHIDDIFNPDKHNENPLGKIRSSKKIFYSYSDLMDLFKNKSDVKDDIILSAFDSSLAKPIYTLGYFIRLIDFLHSYDCQIKTKNHELANPKSGIETEFLFAFSKIFKRLASLNISNLSLKSLYSLFTQMVSSTTIPFYGEPLKGLQIMGILETRTLDFENIIMLSVNENTIPSAKTNNSFIPFDIRFQFLLPTYRDRDSIFAYHFYRLLQRAKNIHLLYNTENDEFGKGEKSRFITQLINELPVYNPGITINNKILSIPPSKEDSIKKIVIDKTAGIINKLRQIAESGFSPSSLNSYRKCPLQFYFSRIKELKEAEEIEETIEAATLGNAVHDALKILYYPFIGKKLTKENILHMLTKAEAVTKQSFSEKYKDGDITSGKNLLIFKVANKFVSNFLKSEIKLINESPSHIIILNLEHKIKSLFNIQHLTFNISIKGIIDRVDTVGNTLRIIDYKTGLVNKNAELTIKDWSMLQKEPALDKSFQLLVYSWLYVNNAASNETSTNILPGIISFRQLSKSLQTISMPPDKQAFFSPDAMKNTGIVISQIISDIFNPSLPFTQTKDRDICKNCPYKGICIR